MPQLDPSLKWNLKPQIQLQQQMVTLVILLFFGRKQSYLYLTVPFHVNALSLLVPSLRIMLNIPPSPVCLTPLCTHPTILLSGDGFAGYFYQFTPFLCACTNFFQHTIGTNPFFFSKYNGTFQSYIDFSKAYSLIFSSVYRLLAIMLSKKLSLTVFPKLTKLFINLNFKLFQQGFWGFGEIGRAHV